MFYQTVLCFCQISARLMFRTSSVITEPCSPPSNKYSYLRAERTCKHLDITRLCIRAVFHSNTDSNRCGKALPLTFTRKLPHFSNCPSTVAKMSGKKIPLGLIVFATASVAYNCKFLCQPFVFSL